MISELVCRFDERVAAGPESPAVVDGDRTLSYERLAILSAALARRLAAAGVTPGDMVGLACDRSAEWVVAVLAILRAGGVYLPLPPDIPLERRRLFLQAARARHVLRHPAVIDDLGDVATVMDIADTTAQPSAGRSPSRSPLSAEHSDRSCVLFTSGTTGTPKGVVVRQHSIVRLVTDTDYIRIGPKDAVAFASNTAFDAVTFEVWALLNGGRVVVISAPTLLSPSAVETALRTHGVTTLFLTTELFNRVARSRPTALRSLTWLLFGGEKANAECVRAILGGGGPPHNLLHMYGPTECTTFATCHRVTALPADATTVPIGTPISGWRIHLLDDRLDPVPHGDEGEICISGAGLAEGYLGCPEQTAAAFTTLPGESGAVQIYRTGDRGRRLADGTIDYVGRRDSQIKLRGFRIETGEVEAVLTSHPAVRDAIVLVYAAAGDTPRLGACLQMDNGVTAANLAVIRAFVAEKLPAAMVPVRLVPYKAFPLTPSKKVDRQRLMADLRQADRDAAEEGDASRFTPGDAVERGLASIWEAILGHPPLHADEAFVDSGADSLQALDLQVRIEHTWRISLSPSVLLDAPTFRGLADHVRRWKMPDIRPVAWLTPTSRRPVLVCIPGVFGHVFFYRNLVASWPEDIGMCALPSRYLDPDGDRRLLTLEEIAEENLARLERDGITPVEAIAGYSFGGLVAYEMARRIAARGASPPALILFDAMAEGEQFRGEGMAGRSFSRARSGWRRIRFHANRIVYRGLTQFGRSAPATRFNPAHFGNLEALEHYRPQPYVGGMLLVRAAAEAASPDTDHETMGWGRLVQGTLTVRDVAASHLDMFRPPHVAEVAAITADYIRRWLAVGHGGGGRTV